ncbi:MAG: HlyD family efflux transporter periplasmic adaptor subunit [Bacteroidales bacterium]|nr:HlyD family efflux transporter periplasmic adaptor subunit [Candidatus Liminaster caballi]
MKLKNQSVVAMVFAAFIIITIGAFIVVGLCLPERAEIIQGEIETTDYRVSSKVPARVLEIRVQEGDHVRKGDTLAILEAPDVNAKLDQVNALYEAAQALDEKARNGAQKEQIQGAYEMWQKAKAGLEVAEKSYNRVANLYKNGVVSAQKYDEVKAQYDAMAATEKAAKAQYDMAEHGARYEDRKAAQAKVQQAQGAINEVSSYIDETVLLAMADGEVTEIFPELGELVGSGAPIMNVAMTGNVYVTFNVREDYLTEIAVGKELTAYVPAFDKDITVRITRIKNVGSFAVWKATKASDGYDLKMFEVRGVPVNSSDIDNMRSGMSVILK